ncbi:MAG: hypothetical protein O6945_14480 [Gammaproteobacteria bacterium]|nr:hypothetical protein [Gammaproteobacteria bacterium]
MHTQEPSLTRFPIDRYPLNVEIHTGPTAQARTPIGLPHGARSNPGGHEQLSMRLGFFRHHDIGKASPMAGPDFVSLATRTLAWIPACPTFQTSPHPILAHLRQFDSRHSGVARLPECSGASLHAAI